MERLWAPWRLAYVTGAAPKPEGCFLCNAWADEDNEAAHLVLARGERCLTIMNRYPYNNGHLMVAPARHEGAMERLTAEEAAELWAMSARAKVVLQETLNADGVNLGLNQGRCAGAGVLDHLHMHVVPRWNGDTNFMPVLADVKVMPQLLEQTYEQLLPAFQGEERASGNRT